VPLHAAGGEFAAGVKWILTLYRFAGLDCRKKLAFGYALYMMVVNGESEEH
jgi:hypothetical protein